MLLLLPLTAIGKLVKKCVSVCFLKAWSEVRMKQPLSALLTLSQLQLLGFDRSVSKWQLSASVLHGSFHLKKQQLLMLLSVFLGFSATVN